MENSFFAVKTTFVNEFRNLCEVLEVDWQAVREGWLLDPRVERDHSDAFKKAPGFGGRCLPKDIAAIISHSRDIGGNMPLLEAVQRINRGSH
jgi:UDP-glucose 6-dehydrogenase